MLPLTPHDWAFLSAFGGAAVMLPIVAAISGWLIYAYSWRVAALWLTLIGAACLLVACTKVAFLGWGFGILSIDFTGISGHTMLSTAVIPVMLYLALLATGHASRLVGVICGLSLGVLVGLSRLALQAHSVSEMVSGCALGAAVSVLFITLIHKREPVRKAAWLTPFTLLIMAFGLHGYRVPTQHWITEVALTLSGHERPFIRARWKANRPQKASAREALRIHAPDQTASQQLGLRTPIIDKDAGWSAARDDRARPVT
jgi:hypothetical protein